MAIETLNWTGADGVAASIANTGYTGVDATGGSLVFEDSWRPRNANSLDANGTSTPGYVNAYHDIAATDVLAYDQPMRPVSVPTSEQRLLFFGTGETFCMAVAVLATGAIILRTGGNTNSWVSAAGVFAPGVPIVVSVYFTRHASAGTARVVVYAEDGVTVLADSGVKTALNTGAAGVTRVKSSMIKSTSSSTVVGRSLFGVPRWDRAASGLLPAWSSHRPFRMWIGGAMVPVDVRRWTGSGYESVTSA